jgi:hypothetical protein
VTLAEARAFLDVSAAEFERMRVKHPSPLVGIANEFTYFHSMFTTHERLALDAIERSQRLRRDATAYLLRGRAEARTPATVDAPPELKARLRALGYLP